MNSKEGLKGLITFIILIGIVAISVIGMKLVIRSANNESDANTNDKTFNPKDLLTETTSDSAKIIFNTDENLLIQLEYSELSDFSNSAVYDESSQSQKHEIVINQLKPETAYFFKLRSKNTIYPEGTYLRFDTKEQIAINTDKLQETPVKNENPTEVKQEVDSTSKPSEDQNPNQNNISKQIIDTLMKQQKENSTSSKDENDYSGFDQPLEYDPKEKTLGAKTNMIGESITKEFKDAVLYNDLRYDFNNDKEVDAEDYPLFIKFVMNQD